MPDDLEGNDKDRFDMGNDEDYYEEEAPPKDIFGEGDGDEDDAENDIFAAARENKELKFANEEMIDKIKKIENEMMDEKKWQMKGEI
jgi:U3 small nucleolar ribonucleoprotein component